MDEIMFPSAPKDERLQMLEDNCEATEELRYFKHYTQKELGGRKDNMTELAIELHDLEAEKGEWMEEWKHRQKPLKDGYKINLEILRLGGEEVKERVYKFVDQEAGQVGYYNAKGQLVSERRIMPSERQMSITRAINS